MCRCCTWRFLASTRGELSCCALCFRLSSPSCFARMHARLDSFHMALGTYLVHLGVLIYVYISPLALTLSTWERKSIYVHCFEHLPCSLGSAHSLVFITSSTYLAHSVHPHTTCSYARRSFSSVHYHNLSFMRLPCQLGSARSSSYHLFANSTLICNLFHDYNLSHAPS